MSAARVVLFDVMDTLVRDPFREDMPGFFGLDLPGMIAAKHPEAWIRFELGEWPEELFLERFFADGRPFDHAGFRACVFDGYRLLPGIEPILVELRERGTPVHAASNYPAWWREIEARTGLARYLRWSFVSCELGVRKPDPSFFRAALESLGVVAEQCVFVDDQPRNCVAASELGLDAIRFEGADALREALATRGLVSGTR